MSRPDNIPEKAVLASVWYVPGKGQRASRWDRVYDLRGTLLTETSHPEDFNATLPAWTPAPDECDNCGRKLRIASRLSGSCLARTGSMSSPFASSISGFIFAFAE